MLSAALLLKLLGTATASPLYASPEATGVTPAPVSAALSVQLLLSPDPELGSSADMLKLGSRAGVENLSRELTAAMPGSGWDRHAEGRMPLGERSLTDQLRDFVNVEPGSRSADLGRTGRGHAIAHRPEFAGIDVTAAADEWIRDTVQSLLASTLRLESNERGRVSFSVLGMGDFSLTLSRDGSQISLAEGDEVLLIAHRAPAAARAAAGGAAGEIPFGYAPGGRYQDVHASPLHQALELVAEIASHPISLLVYCVVATYLVLWSVLSRQQKRRHRVERDESMRSVLPLSHVASTRSRRRGRAGSLDENAVSGERASNPTTKRSRRVRVHVRSGEGRAGSSPRS